MNRDKAVLEGLHMQRKIESLMEAQNYLLAEFDKNEKNWTERYQALEQELIKTQSETQEAQKIQNKLKKELLQAQIAVADEKKERLILANQKEKKDDFISNLQTKVSDLTDQNGRLQRELAERGEEIGRVKLDLQDKEKQLQDLKSSLKQSEQQLLGFHQSAVNKASETIQKHEEHRSRLEDLVKENQNVYSENAKLKSRVQDLLEICREWEIKYDNALYQHEEQLRSTLMKQQADFDSMMKVKSEEHAKEIENQDMQSKNLQDQLEDEVRKVLIENIDKYRKLKLLYDDKIKLEADLKFQLAQERQRSGEQENIIQDLQNALISFRREVGDFVKKQEVGKEESNQRIQRLQEELVKSQKESEGVLAQKLHFEREYKVLSDELETLMHDNEIMREKHKITLQIESELEELSTTLTIKNKMLDDKNDTIDQLKQQLESVRSSEQTSTDDYNRLLKRYERQNLIIEELEGQVSSLQEEFDTKVHELKEKKQLVSVFENELEEIKEKQDNEMQRLKQEIIDKDKNLMDLVRILDEARDNLKRRDDKIKERNQVIAQQDKQLQEIDSQYEKHVNEKEKEINYLRQRLEETQEELKMVVNEGERQKRAAKENLDKLQKVFNL